MLQLMSEINLAAHTLLIWQTLCFFFWEKCTFVFNQIRVDRVIIFNVDRNSDVAGIILYKRVNQRKESRL